jgi:hypothetical protein
LVTVLLWVGGALLLFVLVLGPVGFGAATTGAGAVLVVTGAGDECVVVADGADVVAVAEWVVVAADLGLCAGAFLCCDAGFFVVVDVVVELVCVCGGVDAAGVEVVFEADVPPQPATATAAAMMLSSARFMDPASILARRLAVPGYKTPGMPQRCGRPGRRPLSSLRYRRGWRHPEPRLSPRTRTASRPAGTP